MANPLIMERRGHGPVAWLLAVGAFCVALAGVVVGLLALFEIRPFDFAYLADSRTWIIFAVFTYLGATIYLQKTRAGLPLLLSIPVVAQLYQVTLGWDVPPGAMSPLRAAPLVVMVALLLIRLWSIRIRLRRSELSFLLLWIPSCILSWSASIDLTNVGTSSLIVHIALLPAFYLVIKDALARGGKEGMEDIAATLSFSFVALCAGTLFLIFAGSSYRADGGASSTVTSRSVADVNFVMGYLMLLWPFTLVWKQGRTLLTPVLGLALLVTAALSFSRGALILVPPLVLVSMLMVGGGWKRAALQIGALAALVAGLVSVLPNRDEILGVWAVRLFDFVPSNGGSDALTQGLDSGMLASTSGRPEIWASALALFRESPIWGQGLGSFQKLGPGFAEAHSVFFHVLVEQGLLGFVLVYWFLCALGAALWLGLARSRGFERRFFILLMLSFLGWLAFNHTVASGLVVVSEAGFQFNAVGPLLLLVYLAWPRDPEPVPR